MIYINQYKKNKIIPHNTINEENQNIKAIDNKNMKRGSRWAV